MRALGARARINIIIIISGAEIATQEEKKAWLARLALRAFVRVHIRSIWQATTDSYDVCKTD